MNIERWYIKQDIKKKSNLFCAILLVYVQLFTIKLFISY